MNNKPQIKIGSVKTQGLLETAAFTTRFDKLMAWGRKNSLWPLPYGTACCGIELMSVLGPKYDMAVLVQRWCGSLLDNQIYS